MGVSLEMPKIWFEFSLDVKPHTAHMKTFKLHLVAEVQLPSKAELIRFTDQGGGTTDHIKLGGRLLRPDLIWMEYVPSRREMNEKKWHIEMHHGWDSGTDFTDDIEQRTSPAEWYIEEATAK